MICIEEGIGDNRPRRVPVKVFLINQYPHQFRDSEGGMRLEYGVGTFGMKVKKKPTSFN